ncbi:MAG: aconitate hydratase AcnA [Chloroflexi bacterium]|nr:aconitate hydratase AcnA [Chloroflexota bacterium]
MSTKNSFSAQAKLGDLTYYRLDALQKSGVAPNLDRLPFSIRVMLENVLRNEDGYIVSADDVRTMAGWDARNPQQVEVPFLPARVVMQDFTGVPAVVDLAAMRDAMRRLGKDPRKINPLVPVDLIIDHSVQIDFFGSTLSLQRNADLEFERNAERYEFLAWARQAFDNFRVVPPSTGIIHQVNLEYLSQGIFVRDGVICPDTLVGTDSHTTMINGLGVVGWGVGGIEAEAVMLGQPIYTLTPRVVGFKLSGKLRDGITATDLVLTCTQMLRKKNVVDQFVEFYGPGISALSLPDRATIGNMAPDYGATMGFFPVDAETVSFLRRTNRAKSADLLEAYAKANHLFRTDSTPDPEFTDTLALDLASVEPSLAGPKNPEARVALADMKKSFAASLTAPIKNSGYALPADKLANKAVIKDNGKSYELKHGAVIIAAITSCTNTSNPSVMLGAGLVAKKAVEKGLTVAPQVKTSLAPGSKVVAEYLNESGLQPYLDQLGFNVAAFGCTTCIGNSGPLPEAIAQAITDSQLVAAAVLSGNRNFEGRVNPFAQANYLASPPLVVAYALAGRVDIDLTTEPLGAGKDGQPVYLKDIWPSTQEVNATMARSLKPEHFATQYGNVFDGNERWNAISGITGDLFKWNDWSTYIQNPPYFEHTALSVGTIAPIKGARVLGLFGDKVTTDHISPAGNIAKGGPAAKYLEDHDVAPRDFNQYGTRRGNHEVMMRGTFANIRIKNLMLGGKEGGLTVFDGQELSIYDAAMKYKAAGTPVIVLGGKEYGTGSSRDWAAKGPYLLGVRAVIAESFERIHRSNLVGMGVLPLVFTGGQNAASLGLDGSEQFDIEVPADLKPRQSIAVTATKKDGAPVKFATMARVDTPVEVDYYRNGGILQTVLRRLASE